MNSLLNSSCVFWVLEIENYIR